ncbi:hypothetical protein ACFQ3B_12210 [Stackebrandtia endophytica]|nr:hypothetical protein [Stackebrandtia endophytica]
MCTLEHDVDSDDSYEEVLAMRGRFHEPDAGEERPGTFEQRQERSSDTTADLDPDAPQPLVPLAQLYYRDVPGLPWANRFDLLQILWCPHDHPDTEPPYNPAFQLRWRKVDPGQPTLPSPPRPVTCYSEYVPNPCAVHPETITEYPNTVSLPEPLHQAVRDWQDERGHLHWRNPTLAPGWKALGHGGRWGIINPYPIMCECGREQLPLFTASSGEFGGGNSWHAVEDAGLDPRRTDPVEVTIGRGYSLQLYYCPESEEHPNRTEMF